MSNVLIIDDERDICEMVEMALKSQVSSISSVYCIADAKKIMKDQQFDVVFCDVRLPDGDGLDMLAYINKHFGGTPVCIMTAHGSMDMAIRALKLGASDFINKPFSLKQLRTVCKNLTGASTPAKKYKHPNAAPKAAQGKVAAPQVNAEALAAMIIGESEGIAEVREMIVRVSGSLAPVFIHGESGTGKEVVARAIHEQSARANQPFIAVNCGSIPENLVESEFFGYKKGSFTGADKDKDGLFVSAHGGTLFLDEVADLPLAMQVKLLRALQEKAVRPIGGAQEEAVDVRIISATHKNLEQLVKNGDFREDLFYRLNVIDMRLPPLRERGEDVAILARHLLAKLAARSQHKNATLSKEAIDKLHSYDFPGNVRELENILERALTFSQTPEISADSIRIQAKEEPVAAAAKPFSGRPSPKPIATADTSSGEQVEQPILRPTLRSQNKAAAPKSQMGSFSFELDETEDAGIKNQEVEKSPAKPAVEKTAAEKISSSNSFAIGEEVQEEKQEAQPVAEKTVKEAEKPAVAEQVAQEEEVVEEEFNTDDIPDRTYGNEDDEYVVDDEDGVEISDEDEDMPADLKSVMEEHEKRILEAAIEKYGDRKKICENLGLTDRQLRYKLKKFNLS
ncbi:MAG: sigma 54-interacting transcriptional regulator [Cardiobacteriaceae bacterium]|nr:sigma 54-interacting transcriptional regulator [Cardiobacteriaceae bacterium]